MKRIPIPTVSYGNILTTINGVAYNLTYRFNERSNRWKLDIYDSSMNPVLLGVTLIEGQDLTSWYSSATKALDGFFFIVRTDSTTLPVGRNNLGFYKSYELVYAANNE